MQKPHIIWNPVTVNHSPYVCACDFARIFMYVLRYHSRLNDFTALKFRTVSRYRRTRAREFCPIRILQRFTKEILFGSRKKLRGFFFVRFHSTSTCFNFVVFETQTFFHVRALKFEGNEDKSRSFGSSATKKQQRRKQICVKFSIQEHFFEMSFIN